ncbi:uncharacterized protein DSM5745_07178 [Aspergillus mulundensis]|uniref:Uncharacterized protein n=1 Tax=Aspergillus mulundensis TaxID=1810919 RepID=A0A3D8RKP1_9EURO|nr:hypothetical protein DSM5745_07178 [Aspergillus mulundensis]RDW74516.1 hypothetical protein DSM5745_07178 [Aspergillus mulundensis]
MRALDFPKVPWQRTLENTGVSYLLEEDEEAGGEDKERDTDDEIVDEAEAR